MNTAANHAAAHQAAIAQAIRASGVIVHVEPDDLPRLLNAHDEPLVVHAFGGFFKPTHQYLTSYRGLAFYAKSSEELPLPAHCQVVEAKKIWIP